MDNPVAFHPLTEADIPLLAGLQNRYHVVFPSRPLMDAHVYLSPSFEHGRYVLCAKAQDNRLVGYAAFYPQGEMAWAHILVEPGHKLAQELRSHYFVWLLGQARQLGIPRLTFQNYPAEADSLSFLQDRGAEYAYSIYDMHRSLDLPVPAPPVPAGFEIRQLHMQSEEEQKKYLAAYNECFPEAPLTLAGLQYLVYSPWWAQGVCMTAQVDETLAGSVSVYWEPGSRSGYTEYVFTRPAFRGHGLARALLAESLRYLKSCGLEQAQLEVKAENANALTIYQELGYQLVSESQAWEYTSIS